MSDIVCAKCGTLFTLLNWVYNNRIKQNKNGKLFCSHRCSAMAHIKEESPNWRGGISKDSSHYQKQYPERYQARQIAYRNVCNGKLRKQPCAVCANSKSESHHSDYSKPLEVIWLCKKHHGVLRRGLKYV